MLKKSRAAIALVLAILPARFALSQDHAEFAVSRMPAWLALEAGAVIRRHQLEFRVESSKRATERVRTVATVFNQTGRDAGRCLVFYDGFASLKSLRGRLLDAEGRKIRELKKQDEKDYSAISDFSIYEDSRVRLAELYHDAYPYTVVFEYERAYNGFINWPEWYPQNGEYAVERAVYELEAPSEMPVRFRGRGNVGEPEVSTNAGRKTYRWEEALLPKYEHEPYGPSWREQAASVLTAPQAFEIAGYAGDMSSWQSFGQWMQQLFRGRDLLPEEASAQVQQICAGLISPEAKTRALYEKLQATTRYVSVQLGLGGWQPFDAHYVFTRGYGDCKALSNYMIAMLKAAHVEAYPVLIRSGANEPDVLADFSGNQFNHMIVCVPLEQDTLWLECTSSTVPFGHLGMGNEDRNVLVITPEGGKLARTPKSGATDNMQVRRAAIALSANGEGRGEVRTRYTGNQQDRVRRALAQKTPQERDDWLREEIEVPSLRLLKADFAQVDGKLKEINLPVSWESSRCATRSGARLFLKPNLMERWTSVPRPVEARQQPVDLSYAFVDIDSISYQLPENYVIEAAPAPVEIAAPFGSYSARAHFTGNGKLEYVRRLEVRANKLPPEQYEAYRKFVGEIVKADGMQVVLIKQGM